MTDRPFPAFPTPTLVDRVVTWLSPARGMRRLWARMRIDLARAYYDGATVGRRGASIRRSLADANVISRRTLPKLRAGSHDLVRNNAIARRAVDTIVGNTVGPGIAPQFLRDDVRDQVLEALADRHLETADCDSDGRYTYHGLQAVAFQAMVESGEVLVRRRRRRPSDGLTVPLQFQLLEADFLDDSKDGPLPDGGRIIQGVEFDAIGRRRVYWLFREHSGSDRRSVESVPVPARDIAHVYREDRPGQVRGIPWLAPVMLRIADWADFADAQLVRQKIAACFVAFWHEAFDTTPPPGVTVDAMGNLIEKLEPGLVQRLPMGTDVKFGIPPGIDGYEEQARVYMREIAAGVGVSYEAVSGDLANVNFSSGRMGHLEYQRNIDRWRQLTFIPQFNVPLMGWFLDAAMLVGVDTAGVRVRHVAPRREMIDPNREIAADLQAIRSGQKTLTQAIREKGRDPVEHLREMAADNELLDELGLVLDSDPRQDPNRAAVDAGGASPAIPQPVDRDGLGIRAGARMPPMDDEDPFSVARTRNGGRRRPARSR